MSEHFNSLAPDASDPPRILISKILQSLQGGGSGVSSGVVAQGTGDPNTLSLSTAIQVFNEFDSSNAFVRQWLKDPTGTFV